MKMKNIAFAKVMAALLLLLSVLTATAETAAPKREFRGAWLHVIGQSQWMNKNSDKQREYIDELVERLEEAGCNAIIFQVRPSADAMYKSDLEPWSAWLAGKRGRGPQNPDWDPLEYFVKKAHEHGMELHAWLNPYRVVSDKREVLPQDHIVNKYPERFFRHNGQTFFDPAYQENRDYICKIVDDIVTRYDVDAIHMDDYFYPYPASNGAKFNADSKSYAKFGNGRNLGNWRRENVNKLIEQIHETIQKRKSWVRFGIGPFGIWRNKCNDPRGSESNGLQNYDDLYADVLLWDEKGWVDYLAPQLYWELDLKVAPTRSLAKWWNDNVKNAQLYNGYDTKRTMDKPDHKANRPNELGSKIGLTRIYPNIDGQVWWHGYWVTDNYKHVADSLANNYQNTIALPPAFGNALKAPRVSAMKVYRKDGKRLLSWNHPANYTANVGNDIKKQKATDVVKYLVYEFLPGEQIDLDNAEAIIAMTPKNTVCLPGETEGCTYVVTAIDRMNREGEPATIKDS